VTGYHIVILEDQVKCFLDCLKRDTGNPPEN